MITPRDAALIQARIGIFNAIKEIRRAYESLGKHGYALVYDPEEASLVRRYFEKQGFEVSRSNSTTLLVTGRL